MDGDDFLSDILLDTAGRSWEKDASAAEGRSLLGTAHEKRPLLSTCG